MSLRRRCNYIWALSGCLTVVVFLLLRARVQEEPPNLPPLQGTYQYFREVDFHSKSHRLGAVSHCDARFALDHNLNEHEFRQTLLELVYSYISTMKDLEVETWLAHGTLLGWHWNHKFLPWDTDIDVQMPGQALADLAVKYNMTKFEYRMPHTQVTKKYLLDINPHHRLTTFRDVANKIDGRWIDLTNGKFIDITALHSGEGEIDMSGDRSLFCKDGHRYKVGIHGSGSSLILTRSLEHRCIPTSTVKL